MIFHLPHTHDSQIKRYDLIVLHSWTFLAVTFADAKVVKHVESVMLKEKRESREHPIILVLTCKPWRAPGRTWFLSRCCLLHQVEATRLQIPSHLGQSPILKRLIDSQHYADIGIKCTHQDDPANTRFCWKTNFEGELTTVVVHSLQ